MSKVENSKMAKPHKTQQYHSFAILRLLRFCSFLRTAKFEKLQFATNIQAKMLPILFKRFDKPYENKVQEKFNRRSKENIGFTYQLLSSIQFQITSQ